MKARIGSVEVEGTPAEIAELMRLSPSLSASATHQEQPAATGRHYVSEDVAFRALKRRPLLDKQTAVLAKLRADHPSWTLATDLQKVTEYNRNQLAGLFGAFGKRVAATEGHVPHTWFFDVEWNYDVDCYQYRLPPTVLSAVKRAGI